MSKFKLVYENSGAEVALPAKLKDFRGDPIEVIGFYPPKNERSSGRIEVSDGALYYPSVADLKIVEEEV